MRELDLWEDIYCLTILKLLKENNPKLHGELILKCLVCFCTQVFIGLSVIHETEGLGAVFTGGTMLNGVRLMCTFLLHMMIMPEIKNSLQLIRFSIINAEKFNGKGKYFSVMILQMRLWACILTEALNVYKMSQTSAIEDIVKDFIAFGIISEIDEVIAHSFLQLDVAEELRVNNISYPKQMSWLSTHYIF